MYGRAVLDQDLRGLERFHRVGQQVIGLRRDLELHPISAGYRPRHFGEPDRFIRIARTRRIGEKPVPGKIEGGKRGILRILQVHAPQRHSDDLAA